MDIVIHSGEGLEKRIAGKDNLALAIISLYKNNIRSVCIVFDRAGIGMTYSDINEVKYRYSDLQLYEVDWQSFEYYVLSSKVYNYIFNDYGAYYESLEQYATQHLQAIISSVIGVSYDKSMLPLCLRRDRCLSCINKRDCKYKNFTFDDLVHTEIAALCNTIGVTSNSVNKLNAF